MAELYPWFFRLCILRQSFLAQACLELLILLPQPLQYLQPDPVSSVIQTSRFFGNEFRKIKFRPSAA